MNQEIALKGKTYKVIGVDHYNLTNVLGKEQTWDSYTVVDKNNNKTWISYGVAGKYFTQWAVLSEAVFKKAVVNAPFDCVLTGIANITFEGNPGYSTPFAEMVWFRPKERTYDFLLIERFLKQDGKTLIPQESYFQTGTILKDFKL